MKSLPLKKQDFLTDSRFRLLMLLGMICLLLLVSNHAFATDLLAGTDVDVKDTMKGAGKNWMYYIDGAISLAAFAKTKNPFVFASVLGVAVAMTLILKLATGGA